MIYLILDTNIWIYLANGFNPLKNKHHDSLHFDLLTELKRLTKSNQIKIISNEIIIAEWNRNKKQCYLNIERLKRKLTSFEKEKNIIETDTTKHAIGKNEKHILDVEQFLNKDCINVDVSKDLKVKIFDLALSKKAPFHNSKNNVADCAILLSAVDFFAENTSYDDHAIIFISNNIKDFASKENPDVFHPEILSQINNVTIEYKRQLHDALQLSKEIILEIEEYNKWLESVQFDCQTPLCQSNDHYRPWGYLDENILVKFSDEESENPSQLKLFKLPEITKKSIKVGIGKCTVCETPHVVCPVCDELIYAETLFDEEFECYMCNSKIGLVHPQKGEVFLFVNLDSLDDKPENF